MIDTIRQRIGALKGQAIRGTGAAVAALLRQRKPASYRPGVTVLVVNWNSLPFLEATLAAVRAMSPDVELVVVDNASSDGSRTYLADQADVRTIELPVNVGHGVALDIGAASIDTEYVAVLDIDAFPISPNWLDESIAALRDGAKVAGARMHRNFVHPCFLVTETEMLHRYDLTFRPVGTLSSLDRAAPLFLDVGEALSQRAIVKFGGGKALHFFEITDALGPGPARAVFGNLVYHNMYATQGRGQQGAPDSWRDAMRRFHPDLAAELWDDEK